MIEFTEVRQPSGIGTFDLQLGGLAFYGIDGSLLPIASITNPGGQRDSENEGPESLIAYQTSASMESAPNVSLASNSKKWYDGNFTANGFSSVLRISLASSSAVGGYLFLTAGMPPRRDPVSWTFSAVLPGGSLQILHSESRFTPPWERNALYPVFDLLRPPPSTPPASPPRFSGAVCTATAARFASGKPKHASTAFSK